MESECEKARVHVFVSGRVQGVFYRMFTVREATALGLRGEVRNLPDGRVEVVAEGDAGTLRAFIERLREGPAAATVRDVAVEWESYCGEAEGFRIEYR